MTTQYLGANLWELHFDSNVKMQLSECELADIVNGFSELGELYDNHEELLEKVTETALELEKKTIELEDALCTISNMEEV